MPEKNPDPANELDPGASTQFFQSFVDRHEQESPKRSRTPAIAVGVLVALAIVAVAAWLLLG